MARNGVKEIRTWWSGQFGQPDEDLFLFRELAKFDHTRLVWFACRLHLAGGSYLALNSPSSSKKLSSLLRIACEQAKHVDDVHSFGPFLERRRCYKLRPQSGLNVNSKILGPLKRAVLVCPVHSSAAVFSCWTSKISIRTTLCKLNSILFVGPAHFVLKTGKLYLKLYLLFQLRRFNY